jgi:site-specific DNA-methyltransferase (adenine-specific)
MTTTQHEWPPPGVKWYYADDAVCIAHGDCREIVPMLGPVDAVVTDPPYGIGFKYAGYDDTEANWYALMDRCVPLFRAAAAFVVMPCCQIKRLEWWYRNHRPDWLICWHKGSPGHNAVIGFNDWEPHVCYGKPHRPMHDFFSTQCGFDKSGHPCPKPMEYVNWLVYRACPEHGLILDPFAGSGTTGRAAKDLHRKAILIEREERYCEIAARRMAQQVLPLGT